jgi:Ser/Thr protein kinase RdoA (MazF antagonist)
MHPARITEALGLSRPTGALTPLTHQSSQTWTLDTADGRILLKHTPHTPPAAITYEAQARRAGIAMPTPITAGPADIPGLGPVRAYEWIDSRPLRPDDDIAAWLGRTLALLHTVHPHGHGGPEWYHLHDERWQTWLGTGGERRWKPALRDHLTDILDATATVADTFGATTDHVTTHRDVEPHNVLITAGGPVLIDWDSAGPDSASLEAAHAIYALATHGRSTPDTTVIDRAGQAYIHHGGTPPAGPGILARRLGIRLGRLAERLRISLGEQPAGPRDLDANDNRAQAQIRSIPAFTRHLRAHAALFGRA